MRPDVTVAGRAFRQLWVGATVCAVVFGGTVAASATTYVSSFPTLASRQQLAATTARDVGLGVLLGPISSIDTVGGYTVYKGFVFLTTVGAIWALLAATRLLRGEEDSGRWELVLAGATRPARATLASLVALGSAVAVIFAGTTLFTLLAGRSDGVGFGTGESVLYGLGIVIPAAVFAATGALTSQLGRSRRVATALGMAVFGVAFVIRMIADSGPATHWLRWATPFGWTELTRPFTGNDPWPLVPAVLAVLALTAGATVLAGRRDVRTGVLASHDTAPVRASGLATPVGLLARLEIPVLVAWCLGAAAAAFSFGIIAKIATGAVPSSLSDTLSKFGVEGSFVRQYLGVAFLLVAMLVALLPAGQMGAAGEEETTGRQVHLLVAPVRRTTVLGGRIGLTAVTVIVAGLLAGLAAWFGATTQGVDTGLATMVGAGLNVVPSALVALGIGAVAFSLAPRIAGRVVYLAVIWSVLVDLLGSLVAGLDWLQRLSLFRSMALAPGEDIDVRALVVTTSVAVALCAVALVLFERRDVQSV